jgi:5-methylcytosine-specific restriction enzyme subunit McrC
VFQLRPDLVLRNGDRFPLLIDMKYAWLDANVKASGIDRTNFYQMYAYARRYECPRVLMLYPQTSDMPAPHRARLMIAEGDKAIEAATIDLRLNMSGSEGKRLLIEEIRSIIDS